MSDIEDGNWSEIAANNNAVVPGGWPEIPASPDLLPIWKQAVDGNGN
jgi:hypothetical protein